MDGSTPQKGYDDKLRHKTKLSRSQRYEANVDKIFILLFWNDYNEQKTTSFESKKKKKMCFVYLVMNWHKLNL